MNARWAMIVPMSDVRAVASLRSLMNVEVLVVEEKLWLRGTWDGENESQLLQLVPGIRPYLLANNGDLTFVGERVPRGTLPAGEWKPLRDVLRLQLPPVSGSREVCDPPAAVPLSLERSSVEREATLLATSVSSWRDYANTAPQWRLECLAFAMNSHGQVLIRGTPLPAIPGERWIDRHSICTPSGWEWRPAMDSAVLRAKMGLQTGDLALLHPAVSPGSDTSWEVIEAADWVRASRASIRHFAETST